jgi:hypothetical protein
LESDAAARQADFHTARGGLDRSLLHSTEVDALDRAARLLRADASPQGRR